MAFHVKSVLTLLEEGSMAKLENYIFCPALISCGFGWAPGCYFLNIYKGALKREGRDAKRGDEANFEAS
jgi:hypothetical protein